MKLFFRSLCFLCCFVVAAPVVFASGATANVSWTAPTQYTDGTTLPASDIGHYTITWSQNAGETGPSGSLTVAGSATTATVPVACGNTSFTLTVTTDSAAHYPNATSGPAGPVPYVSGITCAPNPPAALKVS